jgi:anhydro-N-acetylmuramic acid kinase
MAEHAVVTAIGAISGTSMDGIDVAVIRTDGGAHVEAGAGASYPYEAALRDELRQVIAAPEIAEHASLEALETRVTRAHAGAINRFMREQALDRAGVDVIGLHGQTVFHRPERRFTRQLGLGALAAELTGIATINRFRHADVAAGGEGAPLVPLYHQALASGFAQPLMVLNLGGVANVTYLDGDTVIAFDTGPASALLDDFVHRRTGLPFDADGRLSGAGRVDRQILGRLMNNPFFARPAPKSLDRQHFHERAGMVEMLSDADGAATLAAFTVEATARALDHVPRRPLRWLVAGGGRLNATFMRLFRERLGVPVEPVEHVGWDGDFLEAQCFGYLAVRSLRKLPLSLPSTTGVARPLTGGEVWRPPFRPSPAP